MVRKRRAHDLSGIATGGGQALLCLP